jgi:predicted DNA repair protein MutK
MAGASLLALLDDITLLLDDVSVMTKVAARKTAGVLGDDLAVNAEKVTGVAADRELPVVYAVFKGSLLNKAVLVPAALVIATLAPWLITPLLIAGGLFLCFEGFEKVWHHLSHSARERAELRQERLQVLEAPGVDILTIERDKVRGAIRTDFILSAEIIVITLGIVGDASLVVRASVLAFIAITMTIGVYGLVAAIVKIDDLGLKLVQVESSPALTAVANTVGRGLLAFAPRLMQILTVLGTLAMFLVGGGIIVHGIPWAHHTLDHLLHLLGMSAGESGLLSMLVPQIYALALGATAGALVLVVLALGQRVAGALRT